MGEQTYRQIPNLLKKHRRVRRLDQTQVAKLLGLKSGSKISRWENGKTLPSAINMFRLAAVYRVLVDALFAEHIRSIRNDILGKEEKMNSHQKRETV